jgi:hypothetical protein
MATTAEADADAGGTENFTNFTIFTCFVVKFSGRLTYFTLLRQTTTYRTLHLVALSHCNGTSFQLPFFSPLMLSLRSSGTSSNLSSFFAMKPDFHHPCTVTDLH